MPKGYPKKRATRAIETSPRHLWTKDELKKIINMWDSSSMEEILEETGLTRSQISSIRYGLKKAGYVLTAKKAKGYRQLLVTEVLRELKLIK